MELDLERRERVFAPLELVWQEVDSLDQLLSKTPQIANYEVIPGGQRALARSTVAWGPIHRTIELAVALLGIVPERQIRYLVEASSLATRVETTIDLALAGVSETRLHYYCCVEVCNKMAARRRGLFREIAEEQSDHILQRVKTISEQRHLAQTRLLTWESDRR